MLSLLVSTWLVLHPERAILWYIGLYGVFCKRIVDVVYPRLVFWFEAHRLRTRGASKRAGHITWARFTRFELDGDWRTEHPKHYEVPRSLTRGNNPVPGHGGDHGCSLASCKTHHQFPWSLEVITSKFSGPTGLEICSMNALNSTRVTVGGNTNGSYLCEVTAEDLEINPSSG